MRGLSLQLLLYCLSLASWMIRETLPASTNLMFPVENVLAVARKADITGDCFQIKLDMEEEEDPRIRETSAMLSE